MHSSFHREFAQDRQSQLHRSSGVHSRTASHTAAMAADERAHAAPRPQRASVFSPARALTTSGWRRTAGARLGLSGA
jgi:hypothetical protein